VCFALLLACVEKFRKDLFHIACTTLSSKVLSKQKEHFSNIAVDAVLRLKGSTNLDSIHIIKKSGASIADSYLEEGFILEKSFGVGQPKRLEKAKILLSNTAMDTDKIKIWSATVKVSDIDTVAAIEIAERVCISPRFVSFRFLCLCASSFSLS
jgi:T-complex protein 1 subunit beta